jgi:hypothetical protein
MGAGTFGLYSSRARSITPATLVHHLTARERRLVCMLARSNDPDQGGEKDSILDDPCFGWAVEANLAYLAGATPGDCQPPPGASSDRSTLPEGDPKPETA